MPLMKNYLWIAFVTCAIVLICAACSQAPIYPDASVSVDKRVEDLLSRMTREEKLGQMTLVEKNSITPDSVEKFFIGAVLSGGGGYPSDNSAAGWAEMVNDFQQGALATRLAIPLIYGVDAVHGHNNVFGATIFPHNIGLGATRNLDLVSRIGEITAIELIATGIYWDYAPVLAAPQDIRWGRTYEGYSEDFELVNMLGNAFIEGLQGNLGEPNSVLATPKHYIGDGRTIWGTSALGANHIDRGDARVDEETLRAVDLPPYIEAIENGVLSIMVSYSSWNGEPLHSHKYLITEVLKDELGFEGFVVSDWGGIDLIADDYYEAVVAAINAGVDMNMVPQNYPLFIDTLNTAVENGAVPVERIDDAVRRILRAKFAMGLFERPFSDPVLIEAVGSEAHRAVARQAVSESLVLLRNEHQALPITHDTEVIFVAGQAADDIGIQAGGWTIEWAGGIGNITTGTTLLEGINTTAPDTTQVHYNPLGLFNRVTDENEEALIADVGIAVISEFPYVEWEGDNAFLEVSETDVAMVERMRERSEKLIVILISGRPILITEQLLVADAFVAAWLPGTEGDGVAEVLFGNVPFVGQLPYTWPRHLGQIPFDFDDLPTTGCDAPLFPFGYGLTDDNQDTSSSWIALAQECIMTE